MVHPYLMNHLNCNSHPSPSSNHANLAIHRTPHAATPSSSTLIAINKQQQQQIRTTLGSVGKGVIGGGALGRTIPGVGANVLFVPAFTKLAVLARVAAVARIAIDFIIFDIDIKISMGLG